MERPKNDHDIICQVWDAIFMNNSGIMYRLAKIEKQIEAKQHKIDWRWFAMAGIGIGAVISRFI